MTKETERHRRVRAPRPVAPHRPVRFTADGPDAIFAAIRATGSRSANSGTFLLGSLQLMDIGTWLLTKLKGELVGEDRYGNRYYRERGGRRNVRNNGRERRWVMYNGAPEGSKVPPMWHAWLHHTMAAPPVGRDGPQYPWQKDHQPNMTGTALAYRPPGSILKGGRRDKASGDYEPWRPE